MVNKTEMVVVRVPGRPNSPNLGPIGHTPGLGLRLHAAVETLWRRVVTMATYSDAQ